MWPAIIHFLVIPLGTRNDANAIWASAPWRLSTPLRRNRRCWSLLLFRGFCGLGRTLPFSLFGGYTGGCFFLCCAFLLL